MEATQVPINREWIEKWYYMYTIEYCSAIKENKILPLETAWVDLKGIMLREISQMEKKYLMISLICGI